MSGHAFDLLMELPPKQIRLDCAALHLARDRYPSLNIAACLQTLDDLATEIADLRPGLAANLRYEAMRRILVHEHGFTGNREDYFRTENCYLNQVLDTRRGLPIALSILWVEVARRLKWPVYGVALPGRFLARFDDDDRFILVDTFDDGAALSIADCRHIVHEHFDGHIPFFRSYLRPVSNRGILARLLRNLRNGYLMAGDLPRVAGVLERMAAVEPRNGRHLRDLAAVCCRQGDVHQACATLALYLRRLPRARDRDHVKHNLRILKAALAAQN